jgi:hypothetical protein
LVLTELLEKASDSEAFEFGRTEMPLKQAPAIINHNSSALRLLHFEAVSG